LFNLSSSGIRLGCRCIAYNGIHWRRRDFGVQPFSLYSKVHSCTPVEHLASSPAFANEIVGRSFHVMNLPTSRKGYAVMNKELTGISLDLRNNP